MRKWVLAAVAALAVGQAEARTMRLVMSGDFEAIGPSTHQANDFYVSIIYNLADGNENKTSDYTEWYGAGISFGPIKSVRYKFGNFGGLIDTETAYHAFQGGYLQQMSDGSTAPAEVSAAAYFEAALGDIVSTQFSFHFTGEIMRDFSFADRISITGLWGQIGIYGVDRTKPQWINPDFAEFNILIDGGMENVTLKVSPVPLPASAPFLFAALAGLGVLKRRNRNQ